MMMMIVEKLEKKMAGAAAVLDGRDVLAVSENYNVDSISEFEFKPGEDVTYIKEQNLLEFARMLAKSGKANELAQLIKLAKPLFNLTNKAKATKIIRSLIFTFLDMEASTGLELELCMECIDWAKQEKRTFLRQSLEARLVALYYGAGKYSSALLLGGSLLKELKKLDDKILLVEVQLLESKIYHSLSNLSKARAALTTARTTANGIYCAPKLQAALDLQSGILHAAEEKDFKTAYSYFYEAFEGYDSVDNPKAIGALKYMLMCKIMLNKPDDVHSIAMGKLALRYAGNEVDAMKAIARANSKRSLADFKEALKQYDKELVEDPIIHAHLDSLYDTMLEQNLSRIIEPYSRVQLQYISTVIGLDLEAVEKKLSQMILDKKLNGILDQGSGVLKIFESVTSDQTYEAALDVIVNLNKIVDSLCLKVKTLK